jgi:hypothetical protein
MKFQRSLLLCSAVLAVLSAAPARADEENLLAYCEDTEITPAGHWEVYHWLTHRSGKSAGTYRAVDYFAEFEYGLAESSQLSLYLTATDFRISAVPGFTDRRLTGLNGLQVAYKHLLRDHERDGYGLAFYLEPEYSSRSKVSGGRADEFAVEAKLLYQRESRGEKYVYLANLTLEPELARAQGTTERELKLEFSHGVSVRVAERWHVGLENRWAAVFPEWQLHHAGTHAGFVGPTVHYGRLRWWFTATWLRQFSGWPATGGGLALDEFVRTEVRVKFGINF